VGVEGKTRDGATHEWVGERGSVAVEVGIDVEVGSKGGEGRCGYALGV